MTGAVDRQGEHGDNAHLGRHSVLEERLDYRFSDTGLLEIALTHPSYRHEHASSAGDYQRLEFLGDAVLGLLLAEQLYQQETSADEGKMTEMRSRYACGRSLGVIARAIDLESFVRFGCRGDSSPRNLTRSLAAVVEALLGAAWLDGGLPAARRVYGRLFHDRVAELETTPWAENPKGALQELAQARDLGLPAYTVVASEGPDHAPSFRVMVEVGGMRAEGTGGNKQEAETAAACAWLAAQRPRGAGEGCAV